MNTVNKSKNQRWLFNTLDSSSNISHKLKFHLDRHVTTRHDDTFDVLCVSNASWRAYRAMLFNKRDTAKMHELDSVSCSDVTNQVEFEF